MEWHELPIWLLYRNLICKDKLVNLILERNGQFTRVVKSAFCLFPRSAALDSAASANSDIVAQKSRTFTAVSNKRLLFTELHFQSFTNEFRKSAFDPLAVRLASFHTENKVISISNILDTLFCLGRTGHFQHELPLFVVFRKQSLPFSARASIDVIGKFLNFIA